MTLEHLLTIYAETLGRMLLLVFYALIGAAICLVLVALLAGDQAE